MANVLMPAQVEELLTDVLTVLAAQGEPAAVYVIGGAAIALEKPDRIATNDIDGYVRHIGSTEIIDVTEVLAPVQAKWGLEAEWFNYKAHGLGPPVGGQEMFHEVKRVGNAVLYAANTDALLAMKLNAARAKDMPDLEYLLQVCAVTTVVEAEEVFERYYPGDALPDAAVARVQAIINPPPPLLEEPDDNRGRER